MINCPNCNMPQFCPCVNCLPRHNQGPPLLWVWICDGNVSVCGWCGFPCDEDTEWRQFQEIWQDQVYREAR